MLEKAKAYVKAYLDREPTGHDYYHTLRVFRLANAIGAQEGTVDPEILGLMALLHDVDDRKLSPETHTTLGRARKFLEENGVASRKVQIILEGIGNLSYHGSGATIPESIEGKCVQDADRLDAIGAIGIARAFAFGGNRGRMLYDPEDPSENPEHTIAHFYEKLLHLKDKMNTDAGRELALQRHRYMEDFLREFYGEWDGKL